MVEVAVVSGFGKAVAFYHRDVLNAVVGILGTTDGLGLISLAVISTVEEISRVFVGLIWSILAFICYLDEIRCHRLEPVFV